METTVSLAVETEAIASTPKHETNGAPEMSPSFGNIIKALCRAKLSIGVIPANGWNDFHKYKYRKAEDLYAAAGKALAENGIMAIPRIISSNISPWQASNSGKKQYLSKTEIVITLMHESGEWISIPYAGYAVDDGEKGIYKAYTGGYKYALSQILMVGGDDAEESGQGQRPQGQQNRPQGSFQRQQGQQRPQQPQRPQGQQGAPQGQRPVTPAPTPQPAQEGILPSAPTQIKKEEAPVQPAALAKDHGPIVAALKKEGFSEVSARTDLKGNTYMNENGKILSISSKKTFLTTLGFAWDADARALVV